jgi:heme/copper-type cytochrome/quinol oxidase subunit 4
MSPAIRELVMQLKCAERTSSLMVKSSYGAESQIWPIINSPLSMEPEASLVHSEETATGSYPEWDESSSPHPHSQDLYVISILISVIITIISMLITIIIITTFILIFIIIIIIIFLLILFLHLSLGPTSFFSPHFIQLKFFVSSVYNSCCMTNPLQPISVYHRSTIWILYL